MKNILLLVHDDPGQEARLQVALDVARAVGGHLDCVHVTALTPLYGTRHGVAGGALLLELERVSEAGHGERIKARLATEDVPWNWREGTGYIKTELARAAPLADLIVVNTRLEDFALPEMATVASDLLVHSGKPVLAVPETARGFEANGDALVAWDGTDEAFAALAAALPLLRLAHSVAIIQIGECANDAKEAAAYLSRHDIHARILMVDKDEGEASLILIAKATSGEFAYLVMGGFHHYRLAETIFGGVSGTLLRETPIPLLMCH